MLNYTNTNYIEMIKLVFFKRNLLLLSAFCIGFFANAKVILPALVSDGMVLQRDQNISVWGKADVGEKIKVSFQNKQYNSIADNHGNWKIKLPAMTAGGPYTMTINDIILKDILIGDVWLASGQSNMELPMYRVRTLYPKDLETANNTQIRFFTVPQKYNFKASQEDFDNGKWEATNPTNIKNFSAVAYFFAKDLSEKTKVPVGIIHSSLGGSPIQAWMDPKTLKKFPEYISEAEKWKNDNLIQSTEASEKALSDAWYAELNKNDIGLQQDWKNNSTDISGWNSMSIPGSWEDKEGSFDGSVWFKKEIILPKGSDNQSAFLNLGRIKDADETYINGVKVGNVTYEYPPRWYSIPKGVLKEGKNTITVRIINGSGKGEFIADKPYYLEIGNQKIDLTGDWLYKIGVKMNRSAPGQTFIRWKPTGLYNAMINPIINYPIKGVLWYQGESNVSKPAEYGDLLSTMISDWREKWNQKDLPFLIVQLANFMETKSQPMESNWAELRDQQRKVTQTISNTALVVTNDIGEWNDIHPLNKKEVGHRLSLQAQKILLDKKIIADGSTYQSYKIEGPIIQVSFKSGTADFVTDFQPKGFSIKGNDGKWLWANAKIKGNTIEVWNDEIKNPTAVRYAWADNPKEANLKNKSGLPASSFTTE